MPLIVVNGTGLRCRRELLIADSRPSFPEDYIDTSAGREHQLHLAKEQHSLLDKKPKSKKPAYDSYGINSPFNIDWNSLAGDSVATRKQPSILRSLSHGISVTSLIVAMRESCNAGSLCMVTLTALAKGKPSAGDLVLSPTDEQYHAFLKLRESYSESVVSACKGAKIQPIGYLVNGMYITSKGKGFALGYCSCEAVGGIMSRQANLWAQTHSQNQKERNRPVFMVFVRNPLSQSDQYLPYFLNVRGDDPYASTNGKGKL